MKHLKKIIFSIIFALLVTAGLVFSDFVPDVIVTSPNGIWTDTRAYDTIDAAITAIGTNDRDIYIVRQEATTSLTIPSNTSLHFFASGSIANTGQLTLNTRQIFAGDHQIFTGTGDIDFSPGSVIRSAWFSSAIEAFYRTTDDNITLVISKSAFITANRSVGNNVNLRWEAPNNRLTANAGYTLSNIKNIEAGNFQLFAGAGDFDFLDGTQLNLSWFARLRSVTTWIEDENVELNITSPSTVDYSNTTPSNIHLNFKSGGILTVSGGVSLTIDSMSAGRYKIFVGDLTLGNAVNEAYPEWWGNNLVPGTTDMTTFIQSCADATKTNLIPVSFGPGIYKVTSSLNFTEANQNTLTFPNEGWIIKGAGQRATKIYPALTEAYPVMDFTGSSYAIVKDLSIYGISDTGLQTAGILTGYSSTGGGHFQEFRNLMIRGYFNGGPAFGASCNDQYFLNRVTAINLEGPAAVFTSSLISGVSYLTPTIDSKFATISTQGNTKIRTTGCYFSSYDDSVVYFDGYSDWEDEGTYWACDGTSTRALDFYGKSGGSSLSWTGFRMETNHSSNDATGIYVNPSGSGALTSSFLQGNIESDTNNSPAIDTLDYGNIINSVINVRKTVTNTSPLIKGDIYGSIIWAWSNNNDISNYTTNAGGNIVFSDDNNYDTWLAAKNIVIRESGYLYNGIKNNSIYNIIANTSDIARKMIGSIETSWQGTSTTGPAGSDETLDSYTLSGDIAHADTSQDCVTMKLTSWGHTAANANVKTIRAKFGVSGSESTLVSNNITGSPNNAKWKIELEISRVSTGLFWVYSGKMYVGSVLQTVTNGTVNADPSTDTIKLLLTGNAAASDIVLSMFKVEIF